MATYDVVSSRYDVVKGEIPINHVKMEIVHAMVDVRRYLGVLDTILEIGCYHGANLAVYATIVNPSGTIIAMDPEAQVPLQVDKVREIIHPTELVHIKRYSTELGTLDELADILNGRSIDMLMIGGDHRDPIVRADFTIYNTLVSRPGVIMFHDICDRFLLGPGRLYRELCNIYIHHEYIENPNKIGIGALYLPQHSDD